MDRTAVAKIEIQLRSVFDFELAMIARALEISCDELLPPAGRLDRMLPDLMKGFIAHSARD